MLLHISLLLSIFVAGRTRRQAGGAATKREFQAMSDVGRLMPPYFGLRRYLDNNNVYGKVLYISRLVAGLLHMQLCDKCKGFCRIGIGV